jgi:hypothetical protein
LIETFTVVLPDAGTAKDCSTNVTATPALVASQMPGVGAPADGSVH